ncbi:porin family protein [Sphingomonas abietis]|uniref:Preprotein translocase subunit YajC n=1 Tax=Sphingomonas abietis TaxID=3012344 RepID=A0ABY7NTY8_9SPHN|nr:hypothetical protein [Sphingomonas abietis]WBO24118.1 hypothetical protein PBT88_08420 [Sphingomonas abietis]
MRRIVLPSAWLGMLALVAAPAAARTTITPYIEVQQVFTADLSGHDQDAVTYTGLSAGVDATLDGKHVQGQIDYRYDHYFAWSHKYQDSDVHQGLGVLVYQPTPELSFNAAGIATRTSGNYGRRAPAFIAGDTSNTQQIYSAQVGPSYATNFGDLAFNADYRFAWTRASDGDGSLDLGPGQPVLQDNFTTTDHVVDASIGTKPGGLGLPVGLTLSGGASRDQIHFLGGRMDDYYGRADITVPITPAIAAVGGVGYERNRAGQDAILTDADGNAILDDKRHLQGDHSKKRLLSYDQDGLIWDVGVLWRPSARTSLEVRGGKRWGETVVTGHFQHQIDPNSTVEVVAYDDVTSFGRQLSSGVGSLPSNFSSFAAPIPTTLAGCVFGANGGQGGCLPALSSASSDFYRSRGVYANWSTSHGLWTYGIGVDYDHRHYLQPDFGPTIANLNAANSQSVTANGVAVRKLTPVSSVSFTGVGGWYDDDALNSSSYWVYGGALSYYRGFGEHLSGTASVSIFSGSGENRSNDVVGTGMVSVRYTM